MACTEHGNDTCNFKVVGGVEDPSLSINNN